MSILFHFIVLIFDITTVYIYTYIFILYISSRVVSDGFFLNVPNIINRIPTGEIPKISRNIYSVAMEVTYFHRVWS